MNQLNSFIVDCGCFRNGTIGRLGVCDNFDGQCACKPFVGTPPPGEEARVCSQCKDGYYGLEVLIIHNLQNVIFTFLYSNLF